MAVAVLGVALSVFKGIAIFDDQSHNIEEAWTQATVEALRSQHPDKNVMICHVTSVQNLVNATHVHYELPTLITGPNTPERPPPGKPPPGRGPENAQLNENGQLTENAQHAPSDPIVTGPTQGYEIYVFDSGDFFREGDGGFINWCFAGKFKRGTGKHENHVTFLPITSHPPPRPMPPHVQPPPSSPIRSHPDGVYFVNCQKGNHISSGLAYYRNLNPGHNDGQQPDDYIDVSVGSFTVWESAGEGTFKSGTRFYWDIFGNAQEKPVSSYCGTADNTYHPFGVYKDNLRVLYERDGWQCSTIYWCF